ncbi:MAG: thioredoxin [Chlamydiota bacterium]
MNTLTDENFTEETAKGRTLVDFYAEWCGPCRMLHPILEELSQEMEGKVKFGKIDIDQSEKVTVQYQITSVPTLILFENGQEIGRIIGASDKASIKNLIEK